jgi:hypothetical protein
MGIPQRSRSRTAKLVVVITASLALTLVGCGGSGGGKKSSGQSSTKTSASHNSGTSQDSSSPTPVPTETLAQIKGAKDMVITINEATRDSGGFVTINGTITNNGASTFNATSWQGQEIALQSSGASVAGAVLVDEAGKKRYYVLRDTEGKCLCTMGLVSILPKESVPFFAQFPAPPASTTQIQFQLPTMPPANIEISEG